MNIELWAKATWKRMIRWAHSCRILACCVGLGLAAPALPGQSPSGGKVVAWGRNDYGQTNVPAGLTNALEVAAGGLHSLALLSDGSLIAWGINYSGQTNIPTGATNIISIACGREHNLALKEDGTVMAWGYNGYGQTNVPIGLSNVIAVSGGGDLNMALRADGTISSWPTKDTNYLRWIAGLSNVVAVAANANLVLKADGTIEGFGNYQYGQATMPAGLSNIVAIAASWHTLALKDDGTVAAWGNNASGQADVPMGLSNVVAIGAGDYHSVALQSDGKVVAWGHNYYSQTNVPSALSNAAKIAVGGFHNLALQDNGPPKLLAPLADRMALRAGTVLFYAPASGVLPITYQWRHNGTNIPGATNALLSIGNVSLEQAGTYSVIASNVLGVATSRESVLRVLPMVINAPQDQDCFLGNTAILNISAQGQGPFAYQWQFNGLELAGETNANLVLTNISWKHQGEYTAIVSNPHSIVTSSVAYVQARQLHAWGSGIYGQTNVPTGLSNVVAISAGGGCNLALLANGTVRAWGYNQFGQANVPTGLSNVATVAGNYSSVAVKSDGAVVSWGGNSPSYMDGLSTLSNIIAVANGSGFGIALKTSGTVVAWGDNLHGETNVPSGLSNVVAISAGSSHCLALRSDGTVVAWGFNFDGQTNVPLGLKDVVAVSANGDHNLALLENGQVVRWGNNYRGQMNIPPGLSNVLSIAAGGVHGLALRADGTLAAWGFNNTSGITNVPNGLSNVVAISAGGSHNLALIGSGPPVFTGGLPGRTAVGGTKVYFRSVASGALPLFYQWQYNGANIPGATNATLALPNVLPEQAGSYSLMVSNADGVATTAESRLAVEPLVIDKQPQSVATFLGNRVVLTANASGVGPFIWQWQYNGASLPGETNAILTLANLGWSQGGAYSVVVSNRYIAKTSGVAVVSVSPIAAWGHGGCTNVPPGVSNVVDVAAGYYHALALRAEGTVMAWGYNDSGRTNVPAGLSNVVAVAAGDHSLALRDDGTVVAWGSSSVFGPYKVPPNLSNVVAIAAGVGHSLALRDDGEVVAWAGDGAILTNVPAGLSNIADVSCTWNSSVALRADGSAIGWGNNDFGQTNIPPELKDAVAVDFSLALCQDGNVLAWGSNSEGQTNVPPDLTNAIAIAAGGNYNLALKATGTIVGWGKIYNGITYLNPDPPSALSNVVAVSARGGYCLALIGDGPPFFRRRLTKRTVLRNGSIYFYALASGSWPLSYQWQHNGTNVPGANRPVLALDNVQMAQAGRYTVVVSNAFGTATGADAELTVLLPAFRFNPSAAGILVTNGMLRMQGIGPVGWDVILDTSSNLFDWVPWQTNSFTNGLLNMQVPIVPNGRQFFRLRSHQ